MSITRRQFLLGTTAGLILPSFYERAYSLFENHGEPLLIVPKRPEETLYACSDFAEPPKLQLQLGDPGEGPPDMTIREFCLKYGDGDPETWWREEWLGADESEPIDIERQRLIVGSVGLVGTERQLYCTSLSLPGKPGSRIRF
jgi:hypothetical protein